MSGKLSRTVLRRGKGSNPFSLVDYTSTDLKNLTQELNIIQSFSKKGCPYDNACIESFHAIIKKEEVYRTKYVDFQAAKIAIFKYIEGWYNRKRIHSSIGYKTPEQHEMLARKIA